MALRPLENLVRLDGRVAIVTGGRGGMGGAIAALLDRAGAYVVAADLSAPAAEDEAGAVEQAVLDVGDAEGWARLVGDVERRIGAVTILVNCAGLFLRGSLEDCSAEQWEAMHRVNQLGPMLGIRAVVPAMRAAGGGAIVNIASGAAMRGFPGIAGYGASKWGLRGLSRSAAAELASDGIRVNAVHPGAIETPMLHVHSDAHVEEVRRKTPMRRTGTPDEIAKAVLFLVSDMASFVTGADVPVDGGVLA